MSQLILNINIPEKKSNITLPYVTRIIEGMSKVKAKTSIVDDQVRASIVDDPKILKVTFVNRVKDI